MKLNEQQINTLFDFTKSKLVHFYDLQIELVDHLALNIEEEMEKNKNLAFNDALQLVYKKFGIFGFAQIVREKERQLTRTHLKMWKQEIIFLFHWPRILGVIALFVAIYMLSYSVDQLFLTIVFALMAFSFLIINLIGFRKHRKAKKQLLLMQYYNPGVGAIWSYLYLQILIHFQIFQPLIFSSIHFSMMIIMLASYHLNKRIKLNAMKLYPEIFEGAKEIV